MRENRPEKSPDPGVWQKVICTSRHADFQTIPKQTSEPAAIFVL